MYTGLSENKTFQIIKNISKLVNHLKAKKERKRKAPTGIKEEEGNDIKYMLMNGATSLLF